MVNKAIYSIPIFSPQAAPPAGPLISRGGAFGTRAASVLAALAAVRLVGGERLRLAQQSLARCGLALPNTYRKLSIIEPKKVIIVSKCQLTRYPPQL